MLTVTLKYDSGGDNVVEVVKIDPFAPLGETNEQLAARAGDLIRASQRQFIGALMARA